MSGLGLSQKALSRESRASRPIGSAPDVRAEGLADNIASLRTRTDFARHIKGKWTAANKVFLDIGRALVRAQEVLPHGEFEAMVMSDMPFGKAVAFRLRAVAEAIDSKAIPFARLPESYAILYEYTTLQAEHLQLADQRGLIRKDVTKAEVTDFKRSLRSVPDEAKREALVRELKRLHEQRKRLALRMAEIAKEVGPIDDLNLDDENAGPVIEADFTVQGDGRGDLADDGQGIDPNASAEAAAE
jgi:hypothetical protein